MAIFSQQSIILLFLHCYIATGQARYRECEKVNTSVCRNLNGNGYAYTSFPNFLNQSSQQQAAADLNTYKPLITSNCAKELLLFLCTTYIPICQPEYTSFRIAPCKSLCRNSRRACEPTLKKSGYEWPENLNCNKFPEQNEGVCVTLPGEIAPQRQVTKSGFVEVQKGEKINFECPHGRKIYIRKVRLHPKHHNCCQVLSKAIISNMCNGKEKCSFTLDEKVFKYSCLVDVNKLLSKFKCVRSSITVPTMTRIPTCSNELF
ncbi:frizzled-4-like [Hydractinia symbiolongicarpus]|uniref:frizzled-4-like n=1 Tax=Hydractinia symbiolongicarpus TaxID=13093 RepID=UPI00255087C5|nr:frizzled-4-like [Hydractinia symbiolongicarpus]